MNPQDSFDGILAALHEAALDDAHWPAAAGLIDAAVGLKGNKLVVGGGESDDVAILFARFCYRGRRREDLERAYFQDYHRCDERLPRLRRLPHGRLARVSELYTGRGLKTSPAYNEALAVAGCQNGLNVRLDGPLGSRIVWAIADPVDRDDWGSDQTRLIERLLPHIRQLVRVRQALSDAGALGAWLPAQDTEFQSMLAGALPPFGSQGVDSSMTARRAFGLPSLVVHTSAVGGVKWTPVRSGWRPCCPKAGPCGTSRT